MKLSELWAKLKRFVIDKDPDPAASEAPPWGQWRPTPQGQEFLIRMADGLYFVGFMNGDTIVTSPETKSAKRFTTRWAALEQMQGNAAFHRAAILPASGRDNPYQKPPEAL